MTPLENLEAVYEHLKTVMEENERLLERVQVAERSAVLAEERNGQLHHQVKKANAERDFYLRAHTALTAQVRGLATALIDALQMAEAQAYGQRRPPQQAQDGPTEPQEAPETVPAAVRPSVDMDQLARALAPPTRQ